MKKFITILSAGVLGVCLAGGVQATPLSDLMNGGSITVGDKVFDGWTFIDDWGTISPNWGDIEVTGDDSDPDNPGLVYTVSNGALSVSGGDWIDILFGFNVTVTDPEMAIKDNTLEIVTANVGSSDPNDPDPIVYIEEQAFDVQGLMLADKQVEWSLLFQEPTDSATFAPQSALWVETWISVQTWGDNPGEVAELTEFRQHFSQTSSVPAPGSLALLALGVVALGWFRQRG